ncbi:hypothetical protein [Marinobacterium sedimentorum]|nr:hypothetical protein [Marinobacterium sedimentorum]MCP8690331.1 hypothetical protein [Marinobacterium sedimentorum]
MGIGSVGFVQAGYCQPGYVSQAISNELFQPSYFKREFSGQGGAFSGAP